MREERKGEIKMKCKVCGEDFLLTILGHYIARDEEVTGFTQTLVRHDETTLYDAFDCPMCGCQNIMQKRKRAYGTEITGKVENIEDGDEDEVF